MFGWNNKSTRLDEIEESLNAVHGYAKILARRDTVVGNQMSDLKTENEALRIRIKALETNQKQLRGYIIRMGQCFEHDKIADPLADLLDFPPIQHPMPATDHVCGRLGGGQCNYCDDLGRS